MELDQLFNIKSFLAVVVYSIIGLLILVAAFKIFDRLTPGVLWVEIVEKQNVAIAIVTASVMLAIANIIAAAIQG